MDIFEKCRKRLERIGLTKAAVFALITGFAAVFLTAASTWFAHLKPVPVFFLCLGSGVFAAAVSFPLFYFFLFRPTRESVARLVDKSGLDERMITMCEYEDYNSLMLRLQREDAQEKLASFDEKKFKLHLKTATIAALCVTIAFGLGMTVVSMLSATDVIPSGNEVIFGKEDPQTPTEEEEELIEVNYQAGPNGSIEGEAQQFVKPGDRTNPVKAVPDEGYQFVKWSDGVLIPQRWDYNVQESFTVTALFEKIPDPPEGGNDGGDEQQKGEGGDSSGNSGNNGDQGDLQEGDGGDEGDGGAGGHGSGSGAGSSGYHDDNSVIDGETDYKDAFDYGGNMEDLEDDDSIPDQLKDALGDYFDTLRP